MTGENEKMKTKLMVLFFLLLLSIDSSQSALKSYCGFKEKTCNEDWTPFSNMGAVLVGYDLPKGNPFSTSSIEDPGLRKQVFKATFEDEDTGDFVLESGITAREYRMCDNEFKSVALTNMKGYERVRELNVCCSVEKSIVEPNQQIDKLSFKLSSISVVKLFYLTCSSLSFNSFK